MRPFRWDITRREQLGRLAGGERAESYPEFEADLREAAARCVAAAGDSDLVFVGRSPESLFDYLSGVLLDTSWAGRLSLVNLSLRGSTMEEMRADPARRAAFREHLAQLNLDPPTLYLRERPAALIDLVASGSTFGSLTELLLDWACEEGIELDGLRRKLRYVGVTWRTKTSPNTWRWHQSARWLGRHRSSVQNVSIPGRLWDFLGNRQDKVARWHPPWRWDDGQAGTPPREAEHLAALRQAVAVFARGCDREDREGFVSVLVQQHRFREAWCRALVQELRR